MLCSLFASVAFLSTDYFLWEAFEFLLSGIRLNFPLVMLLSEIFLH